MHSYFKEKDFNNIEYIRVNILQIDFFLNKKKF